MTRADLKIYGLTLLIGAVGGLVADFFGFPAPYLTGSAISVTVACLFGLNLSVPAFIRDTCFIAIGLSMGSGVTPEVIDTIILWPYAFAVLILSLLVTFFGCRWMLQYYWSFDSKSATLASSPGHMSFILGLSSQSNVDIATVSIVQSIRVIVLTVLVPFAVSFLGLTGEVSPKVPVEMPLTNLIILTPVAVLIGWGLIKIKFPAALLMGGMLAAAGTHVTGVMEGQIPAWLATIAFAVMGTLIGTRFANVTWHQLRKAASAGLAAVGLAALFAVIFGSLTAHLLGLPVAQLLIAFAPGGLEAMAAMAVIMDVDTTFVAAQHIFRLLLLTFLAPAMVALDERKGRA